VTNAKLNKRVLVLNHYAVPLGGAGGTRHVELFSGLSGWSYRIVASREHGPKVSNGRDPDFIFVPTVKQTTSSGSRVGGWISYLVGAVLKSVFIYVRRPPDVVYASSPHLLAGVAGAVLAKMWGRPLIVEVRDLWPEVLGQMRPSLANSLGYRLLSAIERGLYSRATHIVVLAEGVRGKLLKRGVAERKLTVISNGADSSFFETSMTVSEARRHFGLPQRRVIFLYAGAHGPANGLDLLIDCAAKVNPCALMVLVGDGVAKPELRARTARECLTNVIYMDPLPKIMMPMLLRAADVGLHVLADVELFHDAISPNKIFDYMASGTPILTNSPGMIAHLVNESQCGLSTEPGGLAAGINKFTLMDSSGRETLGVNGMAFVESQYSRKAMTEQLQGLLDEAAP
jgi:glycosyltransferase involved in cell wall biosynthesis